MRIGVDGRELFGQPTGTGRYLGNLCREWTLLSSAKECELVVYTPTPLNSESLRNNVGARVTHRVVPGTGSVWPIKQILIILMSFSDLATRFLYESPCRAW